MTAYAYCRVSTAAQADEGMSIANQIEQSLRYCESKGLSLGDPVNAVIRGEPVRSYQNVLIEAESAYKKKFRERPVGKILEHSLKGGDHIVISKLDRGFRSTIDCLQTVAGWQERGVVVHILDIGIDTSTAIGRMMLAVASAFAEMESARKSERMREVFRQDRLRGHYRGKGGMPCTKVKGAGRDRHLVPCLRSRAIVQKLYEHYAAFRSLGETVSYGMKIKATSGNGYSGAGPATHAQIANMLRAEVDLRELEADLREQGENPTDEECIRRWLKTILTKTPAELRLRFHRMPHPLAMRRVSERVNTLRERDGLVPYRLDPSVPVPRRPRT